MKISFHINLPSFSDRKCCQKRRDQGKWKLTRCALKWPRSLSFLLPSDDWEMKQVMFLEPCVQDKAEKGDFSKGLLHNSIASVGTFKQCKVPDCAVGESRRAWAVISFQPSSWLCCLPVYEPQLQREAGPPRSAGAEMGLNTGLYLHSVGDLRQLLLGFNVLIHESVAMTIMPNSLEHWR